MSCPFQASDLIAIAAMIVSAYSCWQNSKALTADVRPYLYLDLVASTHEPPDMYIRLRNVGRTAAIIDSVSTSVDTQDYKIKSNRPFPLVGITELYVPPQVARIAIINLDKIDKNQWIDIQYHDERGKKYSLHFPIRSFGSAALAKLPDREILES